MPPQPRGPCAGCAGATRRRGDETPMRQGESTSPSMRRDDDRQSHRPDRQREITSGCSRPPDDLLRGDRPMPRALAALRRTPNALSPHYASFRVAERRAAGRRLPRPGRHRLPAATVGSGRRVRGRRRRRPPARCRTRRARRASPAPRSTRHRRIAARRHDRQARRHVAPRAGAVSQRRTTDDGERPPRYRIAILFIGPARPVVGAAGQC